MSYSLSEIEKITGMNRRKIQEYEKHGLSHKPEQEKKKSHRLIYNETHINELYRLRFYHELDYKIPQIKKEKLTEISALERKELLSRHIYELEEKINSLQKLVVIGKLMCETGLEPANMIGTGDIMPYDELMEILKLHELNTSTDEDSDVLFENIDSKKYNEALSRLEQLSSLGFKFDNNLVQDQISEIYDAFLKLTNDSPLIFMIVFSAFIPGSANGEELDKTYGEGLSELLYYAVQYYYLQRKDNPVDKQISNAFEKIIELYLNDGFSIESDEVMEQMKIAYDFFAKTGLIKPPEIINTLKAFNRMICSEFIAGKTDGNKAASRIMYIIILYAIDYFAKNIIKIGLNGG